MTPAPDNDSRKLGPRLPTQDVGDDSAVEIGPLPEVKDLMTAKGRLEAALGNLRASMDEAQSEMTEVLGVFSNSGCCAGAVAEASPARLKRQNAFFDVPNFSGSSSNQAVREPDRAISLHSLPLQTNGSADSKRSLIKEGTIIEGAASDGGTATEEQLTQEVNAEMLPFDWPRCLQLRWQADVSQSTRQVDSRKMGEQVLETMSSTVHHLATNSSEPNEIRVAAQKRKRRKFWIMHPNSHPKMLYDLFSAALLVFDILSIPYMLAWEVGLNGGMLVVAWVTAGFWTLDIFVSFVTAFHRHGELHFEPSAIAAQYIRSWFLPDFAVVACDWVSLIATSSTGLRVLRFAKLGRLLRLMGMFRMFKLARIMEELVDSYMSDLGKLMLRFAKMFFYTVVYVHFISCVWFGIGNILPSDTGASWIDDVHVIGDTAIVLREEASPYQYLTSFHWAMSQITLGAMEITCVNSGERVFGIVCLVFGLLFGSTLVSTLSATMLEVQMDKRENSLKMQMVKRYLRENRVSRTVAVQVEKQLEERLAMKDRLKESDVKGLDMLSTSLRAQLQFNLYATFLTKHGLFRLLINLDLPFIELLCMRCMGQRMLRTQDDLFSAGNEAQSTYFFIRGGLNYAQEPESSPVVVSSLQEVKPGAWIAEAAVSSRWIHVGTAHATATSDVVEMRLNDFEQYVPRTSVAVHVMHDYCRNFHRRLKGARPPASSWPDDLQVPLADFDDIVCSMSEDCQIIIGLDAIRSSKKKHHPTRGFDKLVREVQAGKSTVMLDRDGEIQRIAMIVALKLTNHAGQILVQLWKRESGETRAACQLPGGKQERGELIEEAFHRLLRTKLAAVGDQVEVTRIDREVQVKESMEYGVRTEYLRNIVLSRLTAEVALDAHKIPGAFPSERLVEETATSSSSLPIPFSPVAKSFTEAMSRVLSGSHSHQPSATKSGTDGGDQELAPRWAAMMRRDVYFIPDSKGGILYSWLTESDFDVLRGPHGEELLQIWLEKLRAHVQESGEPIEI